MAIYHLKITPVSRADGRSATAAAAYRSGTLIVDQRTGEVHDYRRKTGVEYASIFTPGGVVVDRADLWNLAEGAEKRKDGRVAREYRLALPAELDPDQRQALATDFARHIVSRYGVAVDMAIHAPARGGDDRNFHCHILATTRIFSNGALASKADSELKDKDLRAAGKPSGREQVEDLRFDWEVMANLALKAAGSDARIDCRSLKAQGIDRAPTVHMGPAATAMERRGIATDLGDINRQIVADSLKEVTTPEPSPVEVQAPALEPDPSPVAPMPSPAKPKPKAKVKKPKPRPLASAQLAPAVVPAVDAVIDDTGPSRYTEPFQPPFFESFRTACQAVIDHQPPLAPADLAESLAAVAVHYSGLMYQRETDTDLALQLMAAIKPTLGQEAQAWLTTYRAGQWTCRDVVAFRPDTYATFDRTLHGAELDPREDTRPDPEQKPTQSPGMCLTLNLRPGQ